MSVPGTGAGRDPRILLQARNFGPPHSDGVIDRASTYTDLLNDCVVALGVGKAAISVAARGSTGAPGWWRAKPQLKPS